MRPGSSPLPATTSVVVSKSYTQRERADLRGSRGDQPRRPGVSLSKLLRNFNVPQGGAQLAKKRRRHGGGPQRHQASSHLSPACLRSGPREFFEPFLIATEDAAERCPIFERPGTDFTQALSGVIEHRHGQHTYILHPGDTLYVPG